MAGRTWRNTSKFGHNDVVSYSQSFAAAVAAGYFTVTAVEPSNAKIPVDFELRQNYPNPFNPSTTIAFSIPSRSRVTLTVYDELGRTIATLIDEEMEAGNHAVVWSGQDETGGKVASGVYLFRLEAGSISGVKKMVILK